MELAYVITTCFPIQKARLAPATSLLYEFQEASNMLVELCESYRKGNLGIYLKLALVLVVAPFWRPRFRAPPRVVFVKAHQSGGGVVMSLSLVTAMSLVWLICLLVNLDNNAAKLLCSIHMEQVGALCG